MAQPSPCASPGTRRRSDGSVRECLFFPVSERNEQERLENLVRRRTREPPENRPKRWTWGGPPDGAEAVDFLAPPTMDQLISKQLSNSSAVLHSADRGSSRSNRSSSNRRSVAGLPEESSRTRSATVESPSSPVRSSSFRANSKGPATPKRVKSSKNRARSPSSPLRQRVDDKEKKIPKSASRELTADSPGTPTGRSVAGTTDAEEASRLLAERRRLARIQKEQEEKQRQEEQLLRAEEERRRQQEAVRQQEEAARQEEEQRRSREEQRRSREEEERRLKEQRWKNMQDQLDREREEAFVRAQKEAERKRQEREQQHLQEEQERQQRKKRIEEIMKRTRKSEVEPPTAASGSQPSEDDASITLGLLETKCCLDDLSDGVQSMDVSPVSRDEQPSTHEFSPVAEGPDQLMEVDGRGHTSPYPRLQAGSAVGDLNKNLLIHGYSPSEPPPLIHSVGPSKIDLQ